MTTTVDLAPTPVTGPRSAPRPHLELSDTISQTLTMAWRAVKKMRRNPEQFFDVTIQPLLFTAMFAYIFGGAISGSTGEYLDYILPGILVMSVLFTTVYSGVSLNTDLTKGVVDRFRTLPIARPAPRSRRRPPLRGGSQGRGRAR